MRVKNINGTTDNSCNCADWLEHWEKFGGEEIPSCCSEFMCSRKAEVGAHVQKDNSSDGNWYIVPLCRVHNAETGGVLEIGAARLVPANVSETCGK